MVQYDPEQDIKAFYQAKIKSIKAQINQCQRRDPQLQRLWASLRVVERQLHRYDELHGEPTGSAAAYGIW